MFGDTFCFDDDGQFQGLTSNTCAHIRDLNRPTKCSYWTREAKVPEFIPFTPEDEVYNGLKKEEGTQCRIANWAFGGLIEHPPNSGKGWLLNDKTLILDGGSAGMELVKVELVNGFPVAEKIPGAWPFGVCTYPFQTYSRPNLTDWICQDNEPRFGCITTLVDGEWVYLLGGKTDPSGWPRNVLARIKYGSDFSQRAHYQFHCQQGGWQSSYAKAEDLTDVASGMGHGMMFKVGKHGPNGKGYMWIGVDKWMSSKLHLGVAERPEGPWDMKDVGELPKILGEKSKTRYCLYVHDWGSDIPNGQLLISWSDDGQMGGLVVAGKLMLAMEEGGN